LLRLIGGGLNRPERRGVSAARSSTVRGPWRRVKLAPVTVVTGACWEGYGSAAERCGSALAPPSWSASRGAEGYWEGALGANHVSSPLLLAWVGAGGTGIDRGTVQQHGSSAWASSNSAAPVKLISF
jgi:hypothetical protein